MKRSETPPPQAPVREVDEDSVARHHGERITHPAFAAISASRISGETPLFDSDIRHMGFVRVTITRATMWDSGGSTHVHGGTEILCEVNMSEAQWVAFVSRMNMGSGTPCTLHLVREGRLEYAPEIAYQHNAAQKLQDQADSILRSNTIRVKAEIEKARNIIAGLPKGKQEGLLKVLEGITMHAEANLKYYRESLDETNEKLVTAAKVEIDAMLQGAVTKFGLHSIQQLAQVVAADPKNAAAKLIDAPGPDVEATPP